MSNAGNEAPQVNKFQALLPLLIMTASRVPPPLAHLHRHPHSQPPTPSPCHAQSLSQLQFHPRIQKLFKSAIHNTKMARVQEGMGTGKGGVLGRSDCSEPCLHLQLTNCRLSGLSDAGRLWLPLVRHCLIIVVVVVIVFIGRSHCRFCLFFFFFMLLARGSCQLKQNRGIERTWR